MKVNIYLLFQGQAAEAFRFYERVLGAKVGEVFTFGNSPGADQSPAEWRDKVMHGTFTVGETALMASDAPPQHYQTPQGFSVSLSVSDPDEAEKLFNGLSDNARKISMPLQQTFWSPKFGMLVDQFGIPWMVNCTLAS
jgi:PhnB protein